MTPSILKAMEFAERKHLGQARDDGQDFYSGHCLVVYQTVKSRRGDAETLCASLLHDTIEDTDTTYEEIVENFGKNVADLVLMVTHTEDNVFPKLKFTDGKYSELVHKAMVIKHADTFVNVSEMYTWTPAQRMKYLNKKRCWKTKAIESDEESTQFTCGTCGEKWNLVSPQSDSDTCPRCGITVPSDKLRKDEN